MEIKMVAKVVLSVIGLLVIFSQYMDGVGLEYVTHQTYNALRIISGWLFLIWIALITREDK